MLGLKRLARSLFALGGAGLSAPGGSAAHAGQELFLLLVLGVDPDLFSKEVGEGVD